MVPHYVDLRQLNAKVEDTYPEGLNLTGKDRDLIIVTGAINNGIYRENYSDRYPDSAIVETNQTISEKTRNYFHDMIAFKNNEALEREKLENVYTPKYKIQWVEYSGGIRLNDSRFIELNLNKGPYQLCKMMVSNRDFISEDFRLNQRTRIGTELARNDLLDLISANKIFYNKTERWLIVDRANLEQLQIVQIGDKELGSTCQDRRVNNRMVFSVVDLYNLNAFVGGEYNMPINALNMLDPIDQKSLNIQLLTTIYNKDPYV